MSGDLSSAGSLDDRGARFTDGLAVERLIGSSNIVVIVISVIRGRIVVVVIKNTVFWFLVVPGKHVLYGKRWGLRNDPRRPSVVLNSRGNLTLSGDT